METLAENYSAVNGNSDWESMPGKTVEGENVFSADKLINAYLKGREDEKKRFEGHLDTDNKILIEKFIQNLNLAQKFCEELTISLIEKQVTFYRVWLRVKTKTEFESIFVVSEDDFVSEDFNGIYDLFIEKEQSINSDTFDFSFSFMPDSKNINEEKLSADGFTFRYGK